MAKDSQKPEKIWCSMPTDKVLAELNTSQSGLSNFEANDRLKRNGLNKLKSKEKNSFFYNYVTSLRGYLIFILLGSILFSKIIGD